MSVCACIVTYQPDLDELSVNIEKLRPQVDQILIVDNASRELLLLGVRSVAKHFDCKLIENSVNLGIADALNQAVEFARTQQAAFILFLDQDSCVSPDFVAQQLKTFHRASQSQRVGLVAPTIVKRPLGGRSGPARLRNGHPILAQTSGSLMPIDVFNDVGLFNGAMFIDYVDYEHCLRMASKDWQIAWAQAAELDHMPGNGTPVSFFGRTVYTVDASPLRHYYETRNCLWTFRHYFRTAPEITTRLVLRWAYVRAHALLFEGCRMSKLKAIGKGAVDALRDQLGKRP